MRYEAFSKYSDGLQRFNLHLGNGLPQRVPLLRDGQQLRQPLVVVLALGANEKHLVEVRAHFGISHRSQADGACLISRTELLEKPMVAVFRLRRPCLYRDQQVVAELNRYILYALKEAIGNSKRDTVHSLQELSAERISHVCEEVEQAFADSTLQRATYLRSAQIQKWGKVAGDVLGQAWLQRALS